MSRVLDYLIVDDDHSQFRLVQALFKDLHMSHRCHHASSGKAALDFLHQRFPYEKALRPDLILLDLNMPGMTGCEVLHSLKKDPLTRAIPTIILSSSIAASDVNACYGEHANAYIQKPVDLDATIKVFKEIDRFWSHVEFSRTTRTDL